MIKSCRHSAAQIATTAPHGDTGSDLRVRCEPYRRPFSRSVALRSRSFLGALDFLGSAPAGAAAEFTLPLNPVRRASDGEGTSTPLAALNHTLVGSPTYTRTVWPPVAANQRAICREVFAAITANASHLSRVFSVLVMVILRVSGLARGGSILINQGVNLHRQVSFWSGSLGAQTPCGPFVL